MIWASINDLADGSKIERSSMSLNKSDVDGYVERTQNVRIFVSYVNA